MKKLQTNIHYENQTQKSLTKYVAYQIQQYIFLKGQSMKIKWGLSQQCKNGLTLRKPIVMIYPVNIIKEKSYMTTSVGEGAGGKIQCPFRLQTPCGPGLEGIFLNLIKGIYEKPTP